MKDSKNNKTRAWELYERGRAYNNSLEPNQYRMVNTNIEFFAGNQWINIAQTPAMSRLPKPTFNIIKRIASLFVASLTSSATTVNFEPLAYYDGSDTVNSEGNAAEFATAEVSNLFDKFKMEYRIREALFDGVQTGDYCAHFYWNPFARPYGGAFGPYKGEIEMELVDGIDVMFGNPNEFNVEKQPYILIVGRDTVENLKEEAKHFQKTNKTRETVDVSFVADNELADQVGSGGQVEIGADDEDGKALYVYMYTKQTKEKKVKDIETGEYVTEDVVDDEGNIVYEMKDGSYVLDAMGEKIPKRKVVTEFVTSVFVTKATRTAIVYENVDTGLSRYPIAWGNWERQKNQYHGRALVTGLIPNQIYINSMFAMVMRHLQLMGFPKVVYNKDLVPNWSNEVGQAIGIKGMPPGTDISRSVAYHMNPSDMSNQIVMTIDKAIAYTKECLGATDAQMGNVRPDNTSALMVLQSSAEVPLENTRAGLYEWLEDIGAILLDMMGTYYGKRPIVRTKVLEEPIEGETFIDSETGKMQTNKVNRKIVEEFDFSQFKHLWFNVKVNAGATNYYSEIAMVQTLDNLRQNGVIDIIQYLERVPDKLIPCRLQLIEELKSKAVENPGNSAMNKLPTMGAELNESNAIGLMPANIQKQYDGLPTAAKKALRKRESMGI